MVVGDDDLDTRCPSRVDRGIGGHPAVDGDDERRPAGDGAFDVDRLEPVALVQAVRQDGFDLESAGTQNGDEQGHRGDAVGVVVAHHRHPLAGGVGTSDALDRGGQAAEEGWRVKLVGAGMEKPLRLREVGNSTSSKKLREEGRQPGRLERRRRNGSRRGLPNRVGDLRDRNPRRRFRLRETRPIGETSRSARRPVSCCRDVRVRPACVRGPPPAGRSRPRGRRAHRPAARGSPRR